MPEKVIDRQQALDLINSMELKHWDNDIIDGQSVIYIATVEDSENNRKIIKSLGYTDQEVENFISYREGEIDLTPFVWDFADWFEGDKFIYDGGMND